MNARIRGMKGRLLDRDALERLIVKTDVEGVMTELQRTAYQEAIEKASVRFSGMACIETAVRNDFTQAFRKVLGYVRGEDAEKYIRILLGRWDLQNIKTILRGKNIHVPASEIMECLVPAGELDEITLGELVKQPDVKSVIDLLATWQIVYAQPLTQNFKAYLERRDLTVLEYAIDRFSFDYALATLKGNSYDDQILRQMIMTEIDVTNVKTVLKLIRDRTTVEDAGQFLLEGGSSLGLEKLESLLRAGSIEAAVKQLRATPYEFRGMIPADVFIQEKISVIEKELDKLLIRKGVSHFFKDPLSIALAVGYLWAKYNEVTNIRIIARCKTADISERVLREELLYV